MPTDVVNPRQGYTGSDGSWKGRMDRGMWGVSARKRDETAERGKDHRWTIGKEVEILSCTFVAQLFLKNRLQ